ncbi:MAG: hypothetical protein LBU53_10475 [Zoogloeaceae bacterium]|jgi:hypothetical protein|nr:hypothetical protein [Zoogloeaceae bacterium]
MTIAEGMIFLLVIPIFVLLMHLSPVWFVAMCILAIAKVPGYLRDWARTNVLITIVFVLWASFFYRFEYRVIQVIMVLVGFLAIPFCVVLFLMRNIRSCVSRTVCSLAFMGAVAIVILLVRRRWG